MGPLSTTESLSQACANSPAAHLVRARRAEARVVEYFQEHEHYLIFHNKKISGVEIDLIFIDEARNIIFVEVKTLSHRGLMEFRLSKRQSDRLFMAKSFFESIYGFSVEVKIAFVDTVDGAVTEFVIL